MEETEKLGRARKSRGEGGGEGGKMKIHSDKEQSKQKQTDLPVV